jgi:hypothetical protein
MMITPHRAGYDRKYLFVASHVTPVVANRAFGFSRAGSLDRVSGTPQDPAGTVSKDLLVVPT